MTDAKHEAPAETVTISRAEYDALKSGYPGDPSLLPEAPAEGAGEVDDAVTEIAVSTIRWAMGRGDDLRDYKDPLEHVLDAALRARSSAPEAREGEAVTVSSVCGWCDGAKVVQSQTYGHVICAHCRGSGVETYTRTVTAAPSADKLLIAARKVLDGLNARIEAAPLNAVPVFDGIVDLHDALAALKAEV